MIPVQEQRDICSQAKSEPTKVLVCTDLPKDFRIYGERKSIALDYKVFVILDLCSTLS